MGHYKQCIFIVVSKELNWNITGSETSHFSTKRQKQNYFKQLSVTIKVFIWLANDITNIHGQF